MHYISPLGPFNMLNYTSEFPEFVLPTEIVAHIFSFLPEHEIVALKQICKTFQGAVDSNAFDPLFMPFLNRLKALDPTISLLPPEPYENHWVKMRVKAEFERTLSNQTAEIAHLKDLFKEGSEVPAIQEQLEALMALNAPRTLQDLEKNHSVLEAINAAMLEAKIDPAKTTLDISASGLTRLPLVSLNKSELQDFWKNLKILHCNQNSLFTLPLANCTSLEKLNCAFNKISRIKVASAAPLEHFQCNNNLLTSLNLDNYPKLSLIRSDNNQLNTFSAKNCPALKKASLNKNRLTQLSLDNPTLESLDCNDNQLVALNLDHCLVLGWLRADNNQLTATGLVVNKDAAALLAKRFGAGWHAEIMRNQQTSSSFCSTLYQWASHYLPSMPSWISGTPSAPTTQNNATEESSPRNSQKF